ncbi:hypothetical protein BT69DRAFT_1295492 [Atractiella rhizophila]|nr:hypothetical protein BT69DRAFT_1295492 [Atractiella rhizophila]
MSSKLSYLSIEQVKNVVDNNGVINFRIIINPENVTVTLLEVEGHLPVVQRAYDNPYTRTFPLLREIALFFPMATCREYQGRYIPFRDYESSSLPSLRTASIINSPSHIQIFSHVASNVSDVCELWREVSAPYWGEPNSVVDKYERLKRYPGAGRLWDRLSFGEGMGVGIAKELIAGSPNVTTVWIHAFWNEEEAKIVFDAIQGLKRVNDVRLWRSSRKWKKEEIENALWRMGDKIRHFKACDVEDSPASASAGLYLSSRLRYLYLSQHPPLPSLSLPHTVKHLALSNMCPLPSCISEYPLPPLLEHLTIVLAPFFADGKISILPSPIDLSHLTHLTHLILDGDSIDVPDFIRWFFGDWRVRGARRGNWVDGEKVGWHLQVHLFFGDWNEEEIVIARRVLEEYPRNEESGIWESGERENCW